MYMDFSIQPAKISEKKIIFALLQPYLSELSRFPDEHVDYKDENGIYIYPYLDAYWREEESFPYLLYDRDKIAGFALVRKDNDLWELAEFYVKPIYRRRSLAETCAAEIFRRHQGTWKISFNKFNRASRGLWRKLGKNISDGEITEGEIDKSHDFIRFSMKGTIYGA
jgi:predicted acetyltransferase